MKPTPIQMLDAERTANTRAQQRINAHFEMYRDKTVAAALILTAAEISHARWPQYANHWQGWQLAQVTKTVRTKCGVAFEPGDITIVNPANDDVAYSVRNGVDTGITGEKFRFI